MSQMELQINSLPKIAQQELVSFYNYLVYKYKKNSKTKTKQKADDSETIYLTANATKRYDDIIKDSTTKPEELYSVKTNKKLSSQLKQKSDKN